jgi:hypothetical protein
MVVESCSPEDYPKFGKLHNETMMEKAKKLIGWIWENESSMPRNRLSVSNECMASIIDLVERRRIYFHVFHGINMSEWNEIALYCFWIAKLHPFLEVPPLNAKARQINEVNAVIAVRTLYNAVNKIRQGQGKERLKRMNISNLIHAFRYRDISKEAVMAIFENLISV